MTLWLVVTAAIIAAHVIVALSEGNLLVLAVVALALLLLALVPWKSVSVRTTKG